MDYTTHIFSMPRSEFAMCGAPVTDELHIIISITHETHMFEIPNESDRLICVKCFVKLGESAKHIVALCEAMLEHAAEGESPDCEDCSCSEEDSDYEN